jgi:hypothetical protein
MSHRASPRPQWNAIPGRLSRRLHLFSQRLMNQRNDIDILRRRVDGCVLLAKSVGRGRDGTEQPTP